MIPDINKILQFTNFIASRSSGKGGQNVNKVSSKVELQFNIIAADCFSEVDKSLIKEKLKNRIDNNGIIHIVVQESRSQLMNKKKAISKLIELLNKSLQIKPSRIATHIPLRVKAKRLEQKRNISQKKQSRNNINWD